MLYAIYHCGFALVSTPHHDPPDSPPTSTRELVGTETFEYITRNVRVLPICDPRFGRQQCGMFDLPTTLIAIANYHRVRLYRHHLIIDDIVYSPLSIQDVVHRGPDVYLNFEHGELDEYKVSDNTSTLTRHSTTGPFSYEQVRPCYNTPTNKDILMFDEHGWLHLIKRGGELSPIALGIDSTHPLAGITEQGVVRHVSRKHSGSSMPLVNSRLELISPIAGCMGIVRIRDLTEQGEVTFREVMSIWLITSPTKLVGYAWSESLNRDVCLAVLSKGSSIAIEPVTNVTCFGIYDSSVLCIAHDGVVDQYYPDERGLDKRVVGVHQFSGCGDYVVRKQARNTKSARK